MFKIPKRIFILSLAVFTLTTLFTVKMESSFDGNDAMGFPFIFYTYLGGKRSVEPTERTFFDYHNLLIDLLLFFLLVFTFDKVIRLRKKL